MIVTREECLRKAEDAERLADESDTEATREAFLATAKKWRLLAEDPTAPWPFETEHREG